MSQLSYLEMVEERGQALVANGVVRTDEVDTLGRQRALRGRGVRLYLPAVTEATSAPGGLTMGALWRLISAAPRVLQDVLQEVMGLQAPQQSSDFVLAALGERRRFASMDLTKHQIVLLDLAAARNLDELVGSWARVHGPNHVLVELESTREALEALIREISAAPRGMVVNGTLPGALPPDTAASAARRAALARDWLPADRVSALLGSTAGNTSHLASKLRREGRILGVWVAGENRYRFPPWQFADTGHVIAQMQPLLALLRGPHGVAPGRETSGWEELEWLLAPNPYLDGASPAERMEKEPQRVLEVAEQQFQEDPDARW